MAFAQHLGGVSLPYARKWARFPNGLGLYPLGRMGLGYFEIVGLPFLQLRGKLGRPNGLGRTMPGWSKLGERLVGAGIYRKNWKNVNGYIVKNRHYRPRNPRTERQQAWRAFFTEGTQAWHNLSAEDLLWYKKQAKRRRLTGFHFFMSRWLS